MSGMHLLPAMYSTTGKKKGKQKWQSAEHKRLAEARQAEWDRKLAEFDRMSPKFSTSKSKVQPKTINDYAPKIPPGRETPRIESKDTGWITCTKRQDNTYTGTKVKGIGTMHKSNGVPIFSDEEAIAISKMRR